jgi:hypothetical protein
MRKELKLRFDGSDSGSKKFKPRRGNACDGAWQSLRCGVCSQAVGFCSTFGRNLTSVAVKITDV